jgi:hypothetical protein
LRLVEKVHSALQQANVEFNKKGIFARPADHRFRLSRSDKRSTGDELFFECYMSICVSGLQEEGRIFTIIGRKIPNGPRSRTLPVCSDAHKLVKRTAPRSSASSVSRPTVVISNGPPAASTAPDSFSSGASGRTRPPGLPRNLTEPVGPSSLPIQSLTIRPSSRLRSVRPSLSAVSISDASSTLSDTGRSQQPPGRQGLRRRRPSTTVWQ